MSFEEELEIMEKHIDSITYPELYNELKPLVDNIETKANNYLVELTTTLEKAEEEYKEHIRVTLEARETAINNNNIANADRNSTFKELENAYNALVEKNKLEESSIAEKKAQLNAIKRADMISVENAIKTYQKYMGYNVTLEDSRDDEDLLKFSINCVDRLETNNIRFTLSRKSNLITNCEMKEHIAKKCKIDLENIDRYSTTEILVALKKYMK